MIRFVIPGEPQPWRRGRLGKGKGGKPMHFKDDRTRANQAHWSAAALDALNGAPPIEGPVEAEIVARFMPPKSTSRVKLAAMLAGEIVPTKRPDADNICKNLDGLNGVAFRDDAQVARLLVTKIYAESAGVDVMICAFRKAA